jgi:hypothetical protein
VPLNGFNPTIDGWVTLLRKYGPLYVDVGYNTGAMTHAIIVTGISGDGTPGGTSIVYVDPVGGSTITMKFQDFLAKFEAKSAVEWPYTIVHWPPMTGAAASLSITGSSVYHSPVQSLPYDRFSRQQNPAVIAGMEVADALQVGLAAASMVQAQVAATQGSFSLTFDKAERLLTREARLDMPGAAKGGKSKYERLVLHIPQARVNTANADIVVRWEGNAYGEIGTVMIERDLAKSTEWSRSSANIVMTWVHQIPTDGIDPRAWPIVYAYSGTYDPLANGYFEFEGFTGHLPAKRATDNRRYVLWSTDGYPKIVNGRSSLNPQYTRRVIRKEEAFPDPRAVELLQRLGVKSVVLHTNRTGGTPWQDAARKPIRGLPLTRSRDGDLLVYEIQPVGSGANRPADRSSRRSR